MTTTTTLSLSLGFGLLLVAGVLACGSSAEPAFKEATGLPFHVSGILFAALALTLFGKSSALRLPSSLACSLAFREAADPTKRLTLSRDRRERWRGKQPRADQGPGRRQDPRALDLPPGIRQLQPQDRAGHRLRGGEETFGVNHCNITSRRVHLDRPLFSSQRSPPDPLHRPTCSQTHGRSDGRRRTQREKPSRFSIRLHPLSSQPRRALVVSVVLGAILALFGCQSRSVRRVLVLK